MSQAFKLWIRLDKTDFGRENSHFLLLFINHEREKGEEKELPSASLFNPQSSAIGIRRDKSESSSTRRVLHMGTKKKGFHRRSKGGDFGKSKFSGLGGVLETSFGFTTLEEVWILPTLVYFPL